MLPPYASEPYSDFTDPAVASAYREALEVVARAMPFNAPVIIGGKPVDTEDDIVSVDPARPDRVVGTAGAGSSFHASQALDAAWEAFATWSRVPAPERARLVHAVGDAIDARRYEFCGWLTMEAGKNYLEAEAEVAEAIDFCRYYAHQVLALAEPLPVHDFPGETNESWLVPMGAGVAIPPWNFPLAILAGMTIGPVAAGNTMVVKPASNTPIIGAKFMEAVAASGIPAGVVNFLPGSGAEIGDTLVDHPRTRFVNFTGSKDVGLRIATRSAVVHPGQMWLKRAYMELGGKDGIIVDETADLDAAADGVVRSAFGFQGQKCSACSRVIVVDAVHDALLDRIVDRTAALDIGPPEDDHAVGPVVSVAQHRSVLDEIDRGRPQAELVHGGHAVDGDGGWYIEPTIFSEVASRDRLGQHEVFGPVLAVIRADDFDDALAIANDTEFGLTGGIFSTDEDRIERTRHEFAVGNLYINRKITGALVGIQPFGGLKLSGSNAKAGGPDYLRLFTEMKSATRKL
ncbi:MAG: L-glutamate gamma-semialdehyde dehydrogenase [Actinomycetota bacterium]|nr:L-glutamate gamma-semialdehyde dehydrogenase [Actinomycetota bacterium]